MSKLWEPDHSLCTFGYILKDQKYPKAQITKSLFDWLPNAYRTQASSILFLVLYVCGNFFSQVYIYVYIYIYIYIYSSFHTAHWNSCINPKTVFWTNVGKIVLIYFLKILPLIWAGQDLATFPKLASWTQSIFFFYSILQC